MTRIAEIRGANYNGSKVLRGTLAMTPLADTIKMLDALADIDCNTFRLPFYPSSVLAKPAECMTEFHTIIEEADKRQMDVWLSPMQWYTSAKYRSPEGGRGSGFPIEWCKGTEVQFWKDLIANKDNLWQKITDMHLMIIRELDSHPNLIGYELLNEPKIFDAAQATYLQFGKMFQQWADTLRRNTQKYLMLCKPIPFEGVTLQRNYIPVMMPTTKRMIYTPHRYVLDRIENEVAYVTQYMNNWKTAGRDVRGIIAGEFGVGYASYGGTDPTKANVYKFVKTWHDAGYGWSYFCAFDTRRNIFNNDLTLNQIGQWLAESVVEIYG